MGKPFPFTVCKACASGGGIGTDGLSAYEIAVKNGFKGTEEEWLDSLQGETPVKGVDYWAEEDKAEIKEYIDGQIGEIDTALDSIIAIQNELIGGDAV